MDLNKISKLTDEEIQLIVFLEKCTIGKWTINKKTGLVDIEGNFDCAKKKLKDFKGVRFGVVTGDFNCDDNKLTSLEGAPKKVDGGFNCSDNNLTSLKGAPQEVGRDFHCHSNNLTSLVGAPQVVKGDFYCHSNNLTSLVGAPQKVGGDFNCYAIYIKSPTPRNTLELVFEVMQENKIDYWTALCFLKSKIDSEEWVVLSKGIDERLSQDAQKGYSTLGQFTFSE
jgi:hypothetical protein